VRFTIISNRRATTQFTTIHHIFFIINLLHGYKKTKPAILLPNGIETIISTSNATLVQLGQHKRTSHETSGL